MKTINTNTLIALGTGTSTGIPLIGCHCQVCTSKYKKNQRLRTSVYIKTKNGKQFLVDTSPDLRQQLLKNHIFHLDFVIMTHAHADHLHGIDDLRALTFGPPKKEINLFTNKETVQTIKNRFEYIFSDRNYEKYPVIGGDIPRLKLNQVELMKEITIAGENFFFFNYPHGYGETMGFIHQKMAYIVDCLEIPPAIVAILREKKLNLLIIDCLQTKPHATHLTVDRCFSYIKEISPKQAGLIHIGHDLSHQELLNLAKSEFGKKVFPLYDQQKITY